LSKIPQGSILGPLLFLIFITDLEFGILNSVFQFADDAKVLGRAASDEDCIKLKLKVNFEIYIADRKATTCIQAKLFLLRCVNPAALPLVRCYSIRHPRRVAS